MRDQMQLKEIAGTFDRAAHAIPGLGMVLFVFDDIEKIKRATGMAIVLRGVKPLDAVRMLREQADAIERDERGQSKIIVPGSGPMIIKSSKS